MTTEKEEKRALLRTRDLLLKLLYTPTSGGYANIPKDVRKMAGDLLRHYPHITVKQARSLICGLAMLGWQQ